nr:asparagine synthase (glutamine-hydrolyzing) [Croceibacterium sp. D39]
MASLANRLQGHRGPDAACHEVATLSNGWRVLLGHQRLSILDLSAAGIQPMRSQSGSSVIIFNGEIYNYLELADKLHRQRRTGTDTEVLLEMAEQQGLGQTLMDANGMWSMVFVQALANSVQISRDRAAEKPLYVWRSADRLVIASEMKTVAALSGSRFNVNLQVLSDYIDQGLQDVSGGSWLDGIVQLPPATLSRVEFGQDGPSLATERYWIPGTETVETSRAEAEVRLRELLYDSVAIRLRADVPVGLTLSGGLDSSILAALIAEVTGDPTRVHAMSSVSPGAQGDESAHIDRVCEALGISTHRVDLGADPETTAELLAEVTWHNDAPLGSFSNVAFYRLMKLARQQGLIVSLSGQGADETFCGYRKYFFWALRDDFRRARVGAAFGNLVGSIEAGTVLRQLNYSEAKRYFPWANRAESALSVQAKASRKRRDVSLGNKSLAERQYEDIARFSVPYLTHYEDRQSMAHGVEVRLPYLDHRIIEFGLSLPTSLKVNLGWTKSLMRTAFEGALPREIIWRRDKQGFSNPQEQWLRGPLRATVDRLIRGDAAIFDRQLLDRSALTRLWDRFLVGDRAVAHRQIFSAWALETWIAKFDPYLS